MRWLSRRSFWLVAAVGLVLLLPFFGSEQIPFGDWQNPVSAGYRILWQLRVPRLALTLWVGGSLAVLGATYQILFHNPLAEPYLLGISSAVTLGIGLGEIFFSLAPYSYLSVLAGLAAALLATVVLITLSLSSLGDALDRIVLFGTGLNFLLSATLFLALSYHEQQMGGGSLRWLFGQIPWLSARGVLIFAGISVPFLGWLFLKARTLDALGLGDAVARTLGVSVAGERAHLVLVTSILVSLIVAFTGSIGFVGLIVPHAVRLLFRPPNTRTLFTSAFVMGAVFLSLSDVVSRAILPPFEFPIGIITTVVGTPFFLYLLWR